MGLIKRLTSTLSRCIPTTCIITFASYPDYTDNAYAVFHYLRKKGHSYQLFWLISDKKKVRKIQTEIDRTGGKAVALYKKSLRGMWIFLRSRYCFYTHGMFEKIEIRQKKDKMVNLWHGMPIKGVGTTNLHGGGISHNQDIMTASSYYFQEIISQCFNIEKAKVLPIGQPRCDLLFEPTDFFTKHEIDRNKFEKVGIWLPTYRFTHFHSEETDGAYRDGHISFLDEKRLEWLDNDLRRLRQLLIIKIHPMDILQDYPFRQYENIIILKQSEMDTQLYPLLGSCDYLLTDYSSVCVDFDVCRKPMGFPMTDLETYRNSRGFTTEQIEDVLPGPIIKNYEQLISFIKNPIYTPAKIKLNNYFDNHATERLLNYLEI